MQQTTDFVYNQKGELKMAEDIIIIAENKI